MKISTRLTPGPCKEKLSVKRLISPQAMSIISWPSHKPRKSLKKAIMCQKLFNTAPKTVELCKDKLNEPDAPRSCVYESYTLIGWPMGRFT